MRRRSPFVRRLGFSRLLLLRNQLALFYWLVVWHKRPSIANNSIRLKPSFSRFDLILLCFCRVPQPDSKSKQAIWDLTQNCHVSRHRLVLSSIRRSLAKPYNVTQLVVQLASHCISITWKACGSFWSNECVRSGNHCLCSLLVTPPLSQSQNHWDFSICKTILSIVCRSTRPSLWWISVFGVKKLIFVCLFAFWTRVSSLLTDRHYEIHFRIVTKPAVNYSVDSVSFCSEHRRDYLSRELW